MQASEHDIDALLRLQQVDLSILSAKKKLAALPQRKGIAALRVKRREVTAKKDQVIEMRDGIESALGRIEAEDADLVAKQEACQGRIDEAVGDYRAVSSLTKDLDGIGKRRAALEVEHGEASRKLAQVVEVEAQIDRAFTMLDGKEAKEAAAFHDGAAAFQEAIAAAEAERVVLVGSLDARLLELYEKTASICGGIAVAELEGGHCSVCRSEVDQVRMIKARNEAPLSSCPFCRRLLVVR